MSLPISNVYNNILRQKQPALPPHPEEVDIMERHAKESGIYIRSLDERLITAEVYKPGWTIHLKARSGSYTGAPTYVKYFIPIPNEQYGKLVEHLFKLITLPYRCYENRMSELRKMSFTIIVKLFEQICKYTAEQIECEIKQLRGKLYEIRQVNYGETKEFRIMELQLKMNAALETWLEMYCIRVPSTVGHREDIRTRQAFNSYKSYCDSVHSKVVQLKVFTEMLKVHNHQCTKTGIGRSGGRTKVVGLRFNLEMVNTAVKLDSNGIEILEWIENK